MNSFLPPSFVLLFPQGLVCGETVYLQFCRPPLLLLWVKSPLNILHIVCRQQGGWHEHETSTSMHLVKKNFIPILSSLFVVAGVARICFDLKRKNKQTEKPNLLLLLFVSSQQSGFVFSIFNYRYVGVFANEWKLIQEFIKSFVWNGSRVNITNDVCTLNAWRVIRMYCLNMFWKLST